LQRLDRERVDVALLEIQLPGSSGLEVLRQMRAAYPETAVGVITAQGAIETAAQVMREGAFDDPRRPMQNATRLEVGGVSRRGAGRSLAWARLGPDVPPLPGPVPVR